MMSAGSGVQHRRCLKGDGARIRHAGALRFEHGEQGQMSWLHHPIKPHMFGELPQCADKQTMKETHHG